MGTVFWLLLFAIAITAGWLIRRNLRQWAARQRAEEARFADFMAGTAAAKSKAAEPAPPLAAGAAPAASSPQATDGLAQQKMLFEAAHKAGEAGEAVIAVQLYGRLLARYPATAFADQARAEAAALKKRLVKT